MYDTSKKIEEIIQNSEAKKDIVKFLKETTKINLKDIIFNGIEEFQSIVEYDFYLINLIGMSIDNLEYDIFFKKIKRGKIKESLFCICDLFSEKYFNKEKKLLEKEIKPQKISILENKNVENNNKVDVNLIIDNLTQEEIKIEIMFIQISDFIEQTKNIWEGWKKYVDINQSEILVIGIKNRH